MSQPLARSDHAQCSRPLFFIQEALPPVSKAAVAWSLSATTKALLGKDSRGYHACDYPGSHPVGFVKRDEEASPVTTIAERT